MSPKQALPKQINTDGIKQEPCVPVWVFSLAVIIIAGIFAFMFSQIMSINDKNSEDKGMKEVQKSVTVLETKFDYCQKATEKFQDETLKRLNDLEKKPVSQIIPEKSL
jgi:uncharacterized protein YoxC